jgi:hypothetical protein
VREITVSRAGSPGPTGAQATAARPGPTLQCHCPPRDPGRLTVTRWLVGRIDTLPPSHSLPPVAGPGRSPPAGERLRGAANRGFDHVPEIGISGPSRQRNGGLNHRSADSERRYASHAERKWMAQGISYFRGPWPRSTGGVTGSLYAGEESETANDRNGLCRRLLE